jgi:hypothetical protein
MRCRLRTGSRVPNVKYIICPDCGRTVKPHGSKHWRDGKCVMTMTYSDTLPRFMARVNKTDTCWLWTRGINSKGYGLFHFRARDVLAHRFAYEALVGPVPDGLELDHLCRVRHCVNPQHLEPVTRRVNSQRGDHLTNHWERRKTHCNRGHEFTAENTAYRGERRWRQCRTCHRERMRAAYHNSPELRGRIIARALARYAKQRRSA